MISAREPAQQPVRFPLMDQHRSQERRVAAHLDLGVRPRNAPATSKTVILFSRLVCIGGAVQRDQLKILSRPRLAGPDHEFSSR